MGVARLSPLGAIHRHHPACPGGPCLGKRDCPDKPGNDDGNGGLGLPPHKLNTNSQPEIVSADKIVAIRIVLAATLMPRS